VKTCSIYGIEYAREVRRFFEIRACKSPRLALAADPSDVFKSIPTDAQYSVLGSVCFVPRRRFSGISDKIMLYSTL
jgi:hypothetical protein